MLKETATILTMGAAAAMGGQAYGETKVVMDTSKGVIEITLDEAKAPKTVENFVKYVEAKFFDGLIFHRVIKGFMIQGGGFTPDMKQKEGFAPIKNEAGNGLKNTVGTIAMARTSEVDSASSQFFINLVDNDFLNHKNETASGFGYAVFGKVTAGLDVVKAIGESKTRSVGMYDDVPVEPVIIKSVRLQGKSEGEGAK